jgi:hypothetical protein
VPAAAHADGAFPAGEVVLVPADRPQRILLATNFGVVLSDDGGHTWGWSCEREENAFAVLYQFGPAPRQRLFAVANGHVIYSDDATCSWNVAGGLLADQSVTDVFADPTDSERVLAVGVTGSTHTVFASSDGGATFGSVLYQASGGDSVNGVEVARSDPRVVYVALTTVDRSPKLSRTADGGGTWTVRDLSAGLGPGFVRIIAVDPNDPNTVLLRWLGAAGGEAIGVTRDGGATVTKPLSIPTSFTSFARMPSGALVVSGTVFVNQRTIPALFVSRDGGASFQDNTAVPGVLALAQRDGILYAAADNFADGYALGASSDEGATWQPVVRFDQIGSIMPCLETNPQCQATCLALAGKGFGSPGIIWDEAVCASPGATGSGGTTGTPSPSSGGCTLVPDAPPLSVATVVLLALLLLARRPLTPAPDESRRIHRRLLELRADRRRPPVAG